MRRKLVQSLRWVLNLVLLRLFLHLNSLISYLAQLFQGPRFLARQPAHEVELRVKVSGRTEAPWPLDESYGSLLWTQYRFHYRADPFLILLRSDVSMLSNDRYLGEAFAYPGGFCAVAGDQPPGPGKERRTGRVLRTRGVAPYRHRSCLGGAARSPGGGGC